MKLGIDIGSTTVKLVMLNHENQIIYSRYERHMSNIFEKLEELIRELYEEYPEESVCVMVTGSGGLALSQLLGLSFEQEGVVRRG